MEKLDGWIIYERKNYSVGKPDSALGWMIEEAKKVGYKCEIMILEEFIPVVQNGEFKIYYKGIEIEKPKFVLFRCYDIKLAEHFEFMKIKTFNNSLSKRLSLDKWRTHLKLIENNIPTPDSLLIRKEEANYEILKNILGEKLIIKSLKGSKGEEVYLASKKKEFSEYMSNIEVAEVLIQRYIETSKGRDIRLYVVGNEVVASVLRYSDTDFRSNFSLGGSAKAFDADEHIKDIAVKSAKVLDLDIAGVDILFGESGSLVCEVNANAGFRTIWKHTDVSVPEKIMQHIKKVVG